MSTRSEAEDVHQEGAHIAYVSHRLTVAATAYHDESARHDLAQQLIDVPRLRSPKTTVGRTITRERRVGSSSCH